jgi:hypothetical protein
MALIRSGRRDRAFGGILEPPVIWKIVAYLKSLAPPNDVPTEAW